GNFGELIDPGLRKIYGDTYKDYPEEYSKIFSVESSKKAYEDTLSMTGFGLVPEKTEGTSISYDVAYQGYDHRLTHLTYGLGFIVTREMYEDDLYRKINSLPRALARSVRHTIEITAGNVLNRAFTSTYAGADGKELCATDHPLIAGGTLKNELTTAADLSMTSFEQALIDLADFTDDRGLLMAAKPKSLVIPSELSWTASQLLGSQKDPESANNAINPANGMVPFSVNHYLTDPDAWFITTDVPNGLVFYWRRRPEFTKDNDFDSENAKWKTTFRMSVGWDDYRGLFASPGN
ncbi:MAG: Mu-like prophage major head subunit gpT family protein, partial [Deltaproteobacteria bacterium]|nr:Mu-like prophage major head subunit gpT family protein [Deltaproteobacteria bacterium]